MTYAPDHRDEPRFRLLEGAEDIGSANTGWRSGIARDLDRPRRAIVVGGGFGGMAAALRLRAQGFAVILIDRQSRLGGRAQVFERDGFRHDAGPTIVTAPFLIDDLFALFDRRREDYVRLVPVQPWYRFKFADGTAFDYGGTVDETLAEIDRIAPADRNGYLALLEHSRALYDVAFIKLASTPFDSFQKLLAQTPRLARLHAYRSLWRMVSRHLASDHLRQAFSIQSLLIGGNPFTTTSIYGLIHHLERESGVYFAMGGTGALVEALRRLLVEQGVAIRLSTTVAKIAIEQGSARGVILETGEALPADVVVSNVDPVHLYTNMIDRRYVRVPTRLKLRSRLSMGLFIVYFGTRRTYENVAHNTIMLGPRYRELLANIFERKVLSDDFSLYVHRPTATDRSFAPHGCDSFYALCPVPNNLSGIDWKTEGPSLQRKILALLEQSLLPELSSTITSAFTMTPDDFEHEYLSCAGAGFSISPNFLQTAWFRFHNRSESVRNLYLVGAGTHPGAGIPGVLCSAQVVGDQIASDIAARPATVSP
jgi:phytoene desaturase